MFRYTTFGLATRGAAENEKGAAVCGYSSTRLGAINWMVATVLAGFAGILITPISGLNPTSFTLFIVPALGAALLGRMTSFSATVVAGLAIGMLQSLMTKLVLQYDWLPTSGLQEGLPFLAIIVALVVFGRSIPWRGTLIDRAMPVAGRPKHVVLSAVLCLAAGTIALFTLGSTLRLGLIQSLIMIVLGLSLVVVTGFAGQISLAQMAFAGFGGFMFGILSGDLSVPFPLALLLAGLATAPLALVVGLPALRTRGIHLAVLTLAAAVALDAFLFSSGTFTGGANGRLIPAVRLFGIDFNIRSSDATAYPRPEFGLLVLVVAVLAGVLVAFLRNSGIGRQMLAIRANERAAVASGVSLGRTKLFAFAASGFIAGLAGSMTGLLTGNLSGEQFQVLTSLLLVALIYIGGVARISGAVVAGLLFAPSGFGPTLLDQWFGIGRYAYLIGGLGLVATTIIHPDGLSDGLERGLRRIKAVATSRGSKPVGPDTELDAPTPSTVGVELVSAARFLELNGLCVAYGGLRAVDDVTMRVPCEGITGLIGPNGAGKTTLIDAVTGFAPITGGSVRFGGRDITRMRAHRRALGNLTRTFQSLELFEDMTVADNVRVTAESAAVVEVAHRGDPAVACEGQ